MERALFTTRERALLHGDYWRHQAGGSRNEARAVRKQGQVIGYEAWYDKGGVMQPVIEKDV
jgi:hypothetical protein